MSTREYKVGQTLPFRRPDGTLTWGEVKYVDTDDAISPVSYTVKADDDYAYIISADLVVDLDRVSADASAALDRIARRDRERGDLLMYLLGTLSAYARRGGAIEYRNEYSQNIESKSLQELVDEYMAKATEI